MNRPAVALLLLLSACPRASIAPLPEALSEDVPEMQFEATVRVDPEGVWLDRADAAPLHAADQALTCFTPFDGRRVRVEGMPTGGLFRVDTLELIDKVPEVPIHAVYQESTMYGAVETLAGEPGTKMEGSTWHAFLTVDGMAWLLWDAPADLPLDERVHVRVRPVEMSPYSTGIPGPTLWIRDFTPDE